MGSMDKHKKKDFIYRGHNMALNDFLDMTKHVYEMNNISLAKPSRSRVKLVIDYHPMDELTRDSHVELDRYEKEQELVEKGFVDAVKVLDLLAHRKGFEDAKRAVDTVMSSNAIVDCVDVLIKKFIVESDPF